MSSIKNHRLECVRRSFVNVILASALLAPGAAAQSSPAAAPASQDAKMKWFRDAKYGLLITWGLYAIPAGEWKGKLIGGPGEDIMSFAHIPAKEYEQLATGFHPAAFNAEEWAQFAEDIGTKYIVITAKQSDGFAMFRSAASKFNVYDATPFHRDPLKELADACAKHKIRLGFSYSLAPDWHEPNAPGNTWDFGPDAPRDVEAYLRAKAEPQVRELLTQYGPVALMAFETSSAIDAAWDRRFMEIMHSLQPAALIDRRLGSSADYTFMSEGRAPAAVTQGGWEASATMNHTWGYRKDDNTWKSTEDLTFALVDAVSKGGNYLLNLGPTAEGVIPQPSRSMMSSLGRWLKTNGEAVYGAGPTAFGDELAGNQWRCTTKPGKLFIHLFEWPSNFEVSKVKHQVTKAYLLAVPTEPMKFVQRGDHVTVSLPDKPPLEYELSPRLNPKLMTLGQGEHVHTVLVLETRSN
jgi:alpha-L-fucosidase